MRNNWAHCKNILCIRPDNLGDLLMSGPAIRALKETFGCRITVLTSSMASGIATLMPEIDEVMIFDVPWVKTNSATDAFTFNETVRQISKKNFDAAVIFTVYSQNPLPTVMLAYLAGIPKRLAYCRENPYQLLTDWIPDQEPYRLIKHQVRRDLDLVATIGATTTLDRMQLTTNEQVKKDVLKNLIGLGMDTSKRWIILHPGVSEPKRAYPIEKWVASGRELINNGYQLVLSGIESEKQLCHDIQQQLGASCWNAAGLFSLVEFVQFISLCPLVVSVNTGTVHIAAAVGTPVVVLYAMTNPQHTPWKVPNRVLPFPVSSEAQSRNEVICHVQQLVNVPYELPGPEAIVCAVQQLLEPATSLNPEPVTIVWPQHVPDQDPARPAS
jgi:lipopolysaccharide heptosyltransferase II